MKSIFNKLFTAEKAVANPNVPLPLPSVTESIDESQRRALIGWIANRMGQKLQMEETQPGVLIYLSFTVNEPVPESKDNEADNLLFLASCLVKWAEKDEDVYLNAKGMNLSDKVHRCLLETYEENKQEICRYIPSNNKSATIQYSEQDEIWQVYRDVIYAVTQRKFLLIRKDEVDQYKDGKVLCSASIVEREDIPKARELAKQIFAEIGVPQTVVMSYLLVISEAITNILKHAREGKMSIVEAGSKIYVLVEDQGPGFPLKLLPNTTLMAGYSTKKSLGQGFTLMMKMTELVMLSTIPSVGSTLILVLIRKEGALINEKQPAG